ncbi:MAG: tagaturonate reductase [Elusimicrobiota bacterium]|jgi:tagaturonate reductase|nr:tagaturonate reductase [Elusimicrobiota bacterium]
MKTINEITKKIYGNYPEKILQFGEGNFLRAFADWMINSANENGSYKGSIVLCEPIPSAIQGDKINVQNGIYTLVMRGIENGKPVEKIQKITSVSRCINAYKDFDALMSLAKKPDLEVIISNTTEAGIVYKYGDKLTDNPPESFPAKITLFLYERFKEFNGDKTKGLLFLPVELIDYNGTELKKIVLRYAKEWNLEKYFIDWIDEANKFTNTLVDRIVTGYPKNNIAEFEEKLGYKDDALVTSEIFNLWVIEGKKEWASILPVHKSSGKVIWTDDVAPYKMRKVRILNGGHTATVLAAYLAGHNTVLDFMNDPVFTKYLDKLFVEEIMPTLDIAEKELETFANAVKERFANPYIKHNLLDISLNSCSKFNARCLPSLLEYIKRKNALPGLLSFSLAAFIKFYQVKRDEERDLYYAVRADNSQYVVKDDKAVLSFFAEIWQSKDPAEISKSVLSNKSFWSGRDLTSISGLKEKTAFYLSKLNDKSIRDVVAGLVK